ncbi:MAG TPA: PilZ domain-containing protein [Sphingomicrobium sp.]|nr:PilZ domain-containing protein [Sphingomicrobium sp.]
MWDWLEQLKGQLIDARRHSRHTDRRSAVLTANGREHRVRLVDLSDAGAMVAGDAALEPGTKVTLQLLDRELLRGQVRWARDGRIGVNFDDPAGAQAEQQDEE